jgi:hypothetical protein
MEGSWTRQLVDRKVEGVEQLEGGALVVVLSGGYVVQIETLWRLLSAGRLTLTSGDDGQLFGRVEPVLAVAELSRALEGQRLAAVDVTSGTADLTLGFADMVLQALSDSSGYEAWQVHGPAGTVAVGQGGGNVVVFG